MDFYCAVQYLRAMVVDYLRTRPSSGPRPEPGASSSPKWDRDRGELRFRNRVIARFQVGRAKNVVRVLDAFQNLEWPTRVDYEDPELGNRSPKGPNQSLHETIRSLNKKQSVIRFGSDHQGRGVVWDAQ